MISLDQLEALWKEHGSGFEDDQIAKTTRLPLSKIYVAPDAFQARDFNEDDREIDKHVEVLKKGLLRDGKLKAIEVFPIAGHWYVLDGHCRLAAYQAVQPNALVAVKVFRGTFDDALARSVETNSQDKLRLTADAKVNTAWRFAKRNELTRKWTYDQLARITNVGRATIGRMVKVLNESTSLSFEPRAEVSWKAVWAKVNGWEAGQWTEERENELAQKFASAMLRAIGKRAYKFPDILKRAVQIAFPRQISELQAEAEAGEA